MLRASRQCRTRPKFRSYATSAPTDVVDNVPVPKPNTSKVRDAIPSQPHLTCPQTREAWLFVDSVFPVRLATWEYVLSSLSATLLLTRRSFRHHIGIFRSDTLLDKLNYILNQVHTHNFRPLALEPHNKEGGVFVRFQYSLDKPDDRTSSDDLQRALETIQHDLREQTAKQGGVPNWCGLDSGNIWLVKGYPWREVSPLFTHRTRLK